MARTLEKTIMRPGHAFFGVPTITGLAGVSFCVLTIAGHYLPGLILMVVIHGASVFIRGRHPHSETLIWRGILKKRGAYDWARRRSSYSG